MKKNAEPKQPRPKLHPDHPVLKRFLGWLDAVEVHATKQAERPEVES